MMVKETKVIGKNPFKDCITKNIKYRSEKEFKDLCDAIEGNFMDEGWTIICKIYHEGRLRW